MILFKQLCGSSSQVILHRNRCFFVELDINLESSMYWVFVKLILGNIQYQLL